MPETFKKFVPVDNDGNELGADEIRRLVSEKLASGAFDTLIPFELRIRELLACGLGDIRCIHVMINLIQLDTTEGGLRILAKDGENPLRILAADSGKVTITM